MVANPEHHLEDFARAGADIISIHVEATPPYPWGSSKIRSLGVKPSVVINPGTPVEAIKHVLHLVDQSFGHDSESWFWWASLST